MSNLILLLCSFIGVFSLTAPQANNISILIDEESNEENYAIDGELMIKPEVLEPVYEILSTNNDNLFITDYFAPYYFSNLNDRFGNNVNGSCTYVAADMLLSYYDTFWNDNFLPEKYDGDTVLVEDTVLNVNESPGSKNESDFISDDIVLRNLSYEDYYNYVKEYRDDFVHFDLLSRGIEKFGLYDENAKELSLGTFFFQVKDVINDYLDESTTIGSESINIVYVSNLGSSSEKEQDATREKIIEKVKEGVPVMIDAANPDRTTAHAFIAYDYDEENDEIYCNAGRYGDDNHHISMTDLG